MAALVPSRGFFSDVAPPLTGNPYGDNASRKELLVTHSLRGDGFDASEDGTGRGTPLAVQPIPILEVGKGSSSRGAAPMGAGSAMQAIRCLRCKLAVRRLTPVECERLQGFPDGYTAIEINGKPLADGPRYKAIGNSMAIPCMKWLGERIEMVMRMIEKETA